MLRLIVVLFFAFVGLQFPSYYFAYIYQIEWDARTLEGGSTPQSVIDDLRGQARDLKRADPVEWPIAFANAFNANRAEETLTNVWEPTMPEQPEDWAYGGAGLVLGFIVTGILSSLFGGRRRRVAAPRAKGPWASDGASGKARKGRAASKIPVSGVSLREASRMAREAFQQARHAAARGSADPAVDESKPTPMDRRVPTAVKRAETVGAVIPSRYRPPAIIRRFESDYAGPIERMKGRG